MRKWMFGFIIILTFCLLLGNIRPAASGILLKYDDRLPELNSQSNRLVENLMILPEDDFNKNEAVLIIGRIANLPKSILLKANLANLKIKLFQGKLTDEPSAHFLQGQTPRGYLNQATTWDEVPGIGGSKLVLVKIGYSERGKGHGSINLELHEFAHSLDHYVFHHISKSKEFLSVWNKEKNRLFPGNNYFLIYPEEYFAECFAMYYFSSDSRLELKRYAPHTFLLMQGLGK